MKQNLLSFIPGTKMRTEVPGWPITIARLATTEYTFSMYCMDGGLLHLIDKHSFNNSFAFLASLEDKRTSLLRSSK